MVKIYLATSFTLNMIILLTFEEIWFHFVIEEFAPPPLFIYSFTVQFILPVTDV